MKKHPLNEADVDEVRPLFFIYFQGQKRQWDQRTPIEMCAVTYQPYTQIYLLALIFTFFTSKLW